MSFLGLVPAERSTGDTIRRQGLTLAGNRRARRALVEAAWTYRHPPRVSETLRARLEGLPRPVRDIAWKAQVRLCARYRPRDGRLPVGDRTKGHSSIGENTLPFHLRGGSGGGA